MSKRYIVEKEFDHNGMKCVVTFSVSGHRCGYVGISKTHPLYGKDYDEHIDIKKEDVDKPVSGVFPLLGAILDDDERVRIEAYFNCHGGITYANGGKDSKYPIESDLWWFGFDCAHYEDGKDLKSAYKLFPEFREQITQTMAIENMYQIEGDVVRDLDYVTESCIELADQLAEFTQ